MAKFLLLQLSVLLLVACTTQKLKSTYDTSNRDPANTMNIVDIHAHLPLLREEDLNAENVLYAFNTHADNAALTFAISDAYLLKQLDIKISKDKRNGLNDQLMILNTTYPNKYFGLCGINLDWDDYIAETKRCLSQSRNIGVKLHLAVHSQSLEKYENQFRRLSQVLHERRKIMLVHFYSDEKTELLSKIAKDYPNASFIIAHGAVTQGVNLIELSKLQPFHPRKNIFIDLSAFYSMYLESQEDTSGELVLSIKYDAVPNNPKSFWQQNPDIVEKWRAFGIDRIMFGTDYPMRGFSQATYIGQCPYLNINEKLDILGRNAIRLLEFINTKN